VFSNRLLFESNKHTSLNNPGDKYQSTRNGLFF